MEADAPLAQGLLFPIRREKSLIFVSVPGVNDDDFLALLKGTQPAYIVELRQVPRFDIGRLNRQTVFECFRREHTSYLDIATNLDWNDERAVAQCLQVVSGLLRGAAGRPLMFITGAAQDTAALRQAIYKSLGCAEGEWQVLEVPPQPTALMAVK